MTGLAHPRPGVASLLAAGQRAHRLPLGAEIALAFATGAGSFALAAAALAGTGSGVVAALLGVVYLVAVIAIARLTSIAYAVAAGMAGMLAFDWYYLPPTHPPEFPDSANLVDVIVYLGVAVLLGELAAHAAGRAETAERAHREIADEQAALRRVATLVARGAPARELFAAVAVEAGDLLDVHGIRIARYEDESELVHVAEWSKPGHRPPPPYDRATLEGTSVSAEVLRTGRAARIDDYEDVAERAAFARGVNLRSVVGAPVVVQGRPWGVILAWSGTDPLPSDTERRLSDFAELVATAISNTEARTGMARLVDEQAALRRVATLVAHGAAPPETFGFVAAEIGRLFDADVTVVFRYEPDRTGTVVGRWSVPGVEFPDSARLRVVGVGAAAMALETGRPARTERFEGPEGSIANCFAQLGARSGVGAPITVEGRLWGVVVAATTRPEGLPIGSEGHIAAFTELVATALADAQARVELRGFAEEQAALRRVATLVARAAPPEEVFAAVTAEVGRLVAAAFTVLSRFEPDGTHAVVGVWTSTGVAVPLPVGTRVPLWGWNAATLVFETGRPARIDDYAGSTGPVTDTAHAWGIHTSAGVPITVEGRLWGVMVAASRAEPLPGGTEARLARFTELVGTAIANTEAQAALTSSRARIVAAADTARRCIERDLHDGAQQRLVSLALHLRGTVRTS